MKSNCLYIIEPEKYDHDKLYELTENIEYGSSVYWMELIYKGQGHLFQLDIQFLREKQLLNDIIESWIRKKIKVEKFSTLPNVKI